MRRPGRAQRTVTSRNLKLTNTSEFIADITAVSSALLQHDECHVDLLVELYNASLKETLDKHAPLTTKRVTSRSTAPWITEEAREARRQRRKAEKWIATRLEVHRQLFVKCRNEVKTLFRAAKKDYYCSRLTDCTSGRQLYSLTNELPGTSKDSCLPNSIPACDLLDSFCTFFCDKTSKSRDEQDMCNKQTDFEHFDGNCTLSCFRAVEESEVAELLKNSLNKSCLPDPLPSCLVKSHKEQLVLVITKIVNFSLLSGTVPHQFRQALVTPLLKKQGLDRNILRNYRPVSNLPFLSKIILSQLQTHLKENNFLEENQSAYRKYRSTETALLDVTSSLLDQADGGQVSAPTLLDLSAAFDTLDHCILLRRLETTFGVCGMALKWFDSYIIIIIIIEIDAAPKLSKYTTALGAYNVKSFTYEINQHMHEHTHNNDNNNTNNTHTRARAHTRTHTQARSKKFVLRKIRRRNKSRRLETLLKEMGFQSLSK